MSKPAYLVWDNLSNRKETLFLFARLPPYARIAFMEACCANACVGHTDIRPGVLQETYDRAAVAMRDDSADEKLTLELWGDLAALCVQYNLDIDKMLEPLTQMARREPVGKWMGRRSARRIVASSGFKGVANGRVRDRVGAPLLSNLAGSGALLVAGLAVSRPVPGAALLDVKLHQRLEMGSA